MVTVAWTSFDGSASGVTVIRTVYGCGAVAGAVYVALFAMGAAPTACAVVSANTPQVLLLQPLP
jgi:hypothetical protein